jgi:hypothetical protein
MDKIALEDEPDEPEEKIIEISTKKY